MTRYSLAVFDFDGTLVDSEACIRQSLECAFAEHDLNTSDALRKDWIGLPLHTIIRSACGELEDQRVESVITAYRTHYARIDRELTFAFPGIAGALRDLSSAGVRLAVATNKHSRPAIATLERLGLAAMFEQVVGAEQVAHPKPHPDILLRVLEATGVAANAALMIGDATVDLQMAAAAGVDACAVTWGNHTAEQLRGCGPRYVVAAPEGLREAIIG